MDGNSQHWLKRKTTQCLQYYMFYLKQDFKSDSWFLEKDGMTTGHFFSNNSLSGTRGRGVLGFGFDGCVWLTLWHPYPLLGVIWAKIGPIFRGFFFPKRGLNPGNLAVFCWKIGPMLKGFSSRNIPMFRDSCQKTDPYTKYMWVPPSPGCCRQTQYLCFLTYAAVSCMTHL